MAFKLLKPGQDKPEKIVEREEKPGKAFARGSVEGALGSYGNILNLLPGFQPGRRLPSEELQSQMEARATPEQLPGLISGEDVAPRFGTPHSMSQVSDLLTKIGIPKEEISEAEQGLGRFGRLFGGGIAGGLRPSTAAKTGYTGAGLAELGKAAGAGEGLQSGLEFIGSLRGGKGGNVGTPATRIRQPRFIEKGLNPKEAGAISPARLEKQLNRVSEEASKIASTIGLEHPTFQKISQAIEKGVPIRDKITKVMNGLEETAREFNPQINTKPLDDFLSKEVGRYTNTGADTSLGKFINEQVQGWKKSGKPSLYSGFRRYRLNNELIREITENVPKYERMSTADQQKINFLTRMNDSLKESFRGSLGENLPAVPGQSTEQSSLWLKAFEDSNKGYSNLISTENARRILNPIIGKNVTDKNISSFLANKRSWEDLNRFLGPEETGKIKQLLEDTQIARNGLMNMPRKDVSADLIRNSITSLIPGIGKFSHLLSIPAIWNWARGSYQSSASFQTDFHKLAIALKDKNYAAARTALDNLGNEKKEPEKKGFRLLKNSS